MTVGSYTCQIFWKGDPSIENFIIRFKTEEDMKRWAQQIESQRRRYRERSRNSDGSRNGGTSQTEFTFMQNQPALENPYAQQAEEDEDEDDDEVETLVGSGAPSWGSAVGYPSNKEFGQSRNASSSSLRSRSTTGDSGGGGPGPPTHAGRQQPPRFAQGSLPQQPQLSLRTRELQQQAQTPNGDGMGDSYFSPTVDSPMSSSNSRTSGSSAGMYPFPRQPVPNGYNYEDSAHAHASHTRFTAPAMGRPQMNGREPSTTSQTNGYGPMRGPGAAQRMHSAQQMSTVPRNRSASSPDIHNGQRVVRNGVQPPVPDMPATFQQKPPMAHMVPRSQSNSPQLAGMVNGVSGPGRAMNQSPQLRRDASYARQQAGTEPSPTERYGGYDGIPSSRRPTDLREHQYPSSRTVTPVPGRGQTFSPPPASLTPSQSSQSEPQPPAQLKVKVHAPSASQVLTLVVPLNISCQSLKDRIDAKLQRSTNLTLGDRGSKENMVKLKYLDDEDHVTIQTDEDVQTAFETWREQRGEGGNGMGAMGEIELFCQR